MKITVDDLMECPDLEILRHELNDRMEAEHKRRLQFYEDVQPYQKMEFINGKVILHSPVKFKHSETASRIHRLLLDHVKLFKLGVVGFDKLMISLSRNDYEPDICYFSSEKAAGFEDETMLFPAPDLVVEVLSKSTAYRVRGIKFRDYATHGIPEYWIVSPTQKCIEQYRLYKGEYQLGSKWQTGIIQSFVVPGFQMEVAAAFDEDVFLAVIEKDKQEIVKLNKQIVAKDNLLSERENQISEKDNLLSEKDNLLSEKDNLLSEKDRIIEELQRKLIP